MPRRAFMPPACCDRCGQPPRLGETLYHRDGWPCASCLDKETPGKDATSKTAFYAAKAAFHRSVAIQCRAGGEEEAAHDDQRHSRWQAEAADVLQQAANNRARAAQVALGEVIPEQAGYLKDTLSLPDFIAVDASLERTRLLMADGVDTLALALDAANSAGARSSIEKMHLHQLAIVHKTALEHMRRAACTLDPDLQGKQYEAANRFIRTFQQGLIALVRLRGGGTPIIQHVHINDGGQAVVGAVQNGSSSSAAHKTTIED